MNRDTLIRTVARETGEACGIVDQIVRAALSHIASAVERGEDVRIDDFGAWISERVGARHDAPAYNAVRFRACHSWRKRMNAQQEV